MRRRKYSWVMSFRDDSNEGNLPKVLAFGVLRGNLSDFRVNCSEMLWEAMRSTGRDIGRKSSIKTGGEPASLQMSSNT